MENVIKINPEVQVVAFEKVCLVNTPSKVVRPTDLDPNSFCKTLKALQASKDLKAVMRVLGTLVEQDSIPQLLEDLKSWGVIEENNDLSSSSVLKSEHRG